MYTDFGYSGRCTSANLRLPIGSISASYSVAILQIFTSGHVGLRWSTSVYIRLREVDQSRPTVSTHVSTPVDGPLVYLQSTIYKKPERSEFGAGLRNLGAAQAKPKDQAS
ncbi:hypothetical protein B0H13DRAFT_1851355 [Mycena leptocephala]|nr:hypothetical protein B0H13DRAFT_1851355 [Mycena leptocephala]